MCPQPWAIDRRPGRAELDRYPPPSPARPPGHFDAGFEAGLDILVKGIEAIAGDGTR